jgi:diguanylate cyclase (GGDEF)-like protein
LLGPITNRMCRVLAKLALLLPAMAAAQQMPLRYYGQQDGLANLAITAMVRDQAGYLWIGTQNGLFRYNGADFRRYGLAEGLGEPLITAMLADHENKLWVGNYNGLFLKVGERLLPVLRDDGRKIDIWSAQSLAVSPDGQRYVVTGQKVYTLGLRDGKTQVQPVFSTEQIERHVALASISSVLPEADAALWLGCGESLCHSGPRGITVWAAAQGVPADNWQAILRDRSGQLWARGDHHIVALPSGARSFIDRTPPGDLLRKDNLLPVLVEDSQGRVLSNVDDGLVRWDQTRWEHYGPANDLRSAGGINALQFDQDGGLWLGSLGLGLINWMGYGNWENWTVAQGLPDNVVLSFVRDAAGALYVGTRSGLARMPAEAQRFAPAAAKLPAHQWSSLALDQRGQIWASTYSGMLARIAVDGSASVHARGLPGISMLTVDRGQRLWLATNDGVAVANISGQAGPVRPPEELFQPTGDAIAAFGAQCQDAGGALWFISQRQMLQLEGTRWSRYVLHQPGGDADWSAMSCSSDGSLWLSDVRGRLWRANLGQQGLQLKHVDNPLLQNANIINMHEDRRGWLWIGTDAGIAVWNREHWRFFNQNDGLIWNDTNGRVFYEDADGSMWIATSNGVSHVRRPELLFAPQKLGVRIEAARRDAQPLALEQPWLLPWSNAPLELDLASLHYQNRHALRFHYRLAGLENGWTESAVPQLRYAVLPPGDYQFEYYASNAYSHSVSPIEKQVVTVLPPWWRTTWFYLLCGISALLLLTLLYRLRVRHLLRRQLLTEQLVRERTRELELSREQLRQRALRDALTGAWNRGAIMEIIEHALAQAITNQQPLLLVLLDLDHFKRVNDSYGHGAGDTVLREAVARLSASVRQTDAVGRYGGEEFLVLLPGLDQAGGHGRVEELRHAIRRAPISISEQQSITVTGSFGAIAFDPSRPLPVAELIDRADQALYRSKENGRDRIEYASTGD